MRFEWDADKAQSNFEKHGVRFEIASGVFIDPGRITAVDDRFDYGEERLVTLARTSEGILGVEPQNATKGTPCGLYQPVKANKRERSTYGDC